MLYVEQRAPQRTRFAMMLYVALSLGGCATGAKRVSIDANARTDDGGMSSLDFLTMTQRMAAEIASLQGLAAPGESARIAFLRMENRSSELLDTVAMQEKIRSNVLRHANGRVRFLDRTAVEAILQEREQKRDGSLSSTHTSALSGADYFLSGSVSSIHQTVKNKSSNYMRFSFRLVDAESSEVVWENEYEFKKVGSRALWDQ